MSDVKHHSAMMAKFSFETEEDHRGVIIHRAQMYRLVSCEHLFQLTNIRTADPTLEVSAVVGRQVLAAGMIQTINYERSHAAVGDDPIRNAVAVAKAVFERAARDDLYLGVDFA